MRNALRRSWILVGLTFACAQAPLPQSDPTDLERLFPRTVTPAALSRQLYNLRTAFEARFVLGRLSESFYQVLTQMGRRLLDAMVRPQAESPRDTRGPLAPIPVVVKLIEGHRLDAAQNLVWTTYAWPPASIFLPRTLLMGLLHENEVAALMAVHLLTLGDLPGDYAPGQAPLPDVVGAIALLYRAGYDPRGFLQLGHLYQDSPEHSPYSPRVLQEWLEKGQQEISASPPLRRPQVNSPAFLQARYEWLFQEAKRGPKKGS